MEIKRGRLGCLVSQVRRNQYHEWITSWKVHLLGGLKVPWCCLHWPLPELPALSSRLAKSHRCLLLPSRLFAPPPPDLLLLLPCYQFGHHSLLPFGSLWRCFLTIPSVSAVWFFRVPLYQLTRGLVHPHHHPPLRSECCYLFDFLAWSTRLPTAA